MAGLPWFEVETTAPDHPKTVALELLLKSDAAFTYIARLWAYCYGTHLSDRFEGPHAEAAIERVVRWPGKRGAFVQAAIECRVRPDGVGYLERDGDALVVRGVAERLEPHLAKRESDRARIAEKRGKASASIRSRADVAATPERRSADVAGNTDKDKDTNKDKIVSETATASEQKAGGGGRLEEVASRLASALGRDRIGIGKDEQRVEASFARYLDRGLEQELVTDCLSIAHEKGVSPAHLSWWAGWLDTVTEAELDAAQRRRTEARS
jgi:hypothetical protein